MSDIEIRKPLPFLLKEINFDLRTTLITITKVITATGTGDIKGVIESVTDLLGVGKHVDTPEELLWKLISTALKDSIIKTSYDYKEIFSRECSKYNGNLGSWTDFNVEHEIKKIECKIDSRFFLSPKDSDFVTDFSPVLNRWLTYIGFVDFEISAFVNKFKTNFVLSLNKEWLDNNTVYVSLFDKLNTPFSKAKNNELKWINYQALIASYCRDRMFNEVFGLSDVYVPLRGWYKSKVKEHDKRHVIDIESNILKWLSSDKLSNPIKLISGGPGSGKSSFSKMLINKICENRYHNLLYVPLHQLDINIDLFTSLEKFTTQHPAIGFNVVSGEHSYGDLVLVFDGLDELSMQGLAASETAIQFIDDLIRLLYKVNSQGRRWKAIVTGRDISIQSSETIIKSNEQVINIIPYYVDREEMSEYEDVDNLLYVDQRDVWWSNFGRVIGKKYNSFPKELNNKKLIPITKEPLLNYLVSFTYTRGDLKLRDDVSLNQIYLDLLRQVHSRDYESSLHLGSRHLEFENFIEVLEEIALTVWKGGNGRTATEKQIYDQLNDNGLSSYFEHFSEGAKKGVVRLLTAFYFRQFSEGVSTERTFEFTHKSFGEYLTARRIVEEVFYLSKNVSKHKYSRREGFDNEIALIKWIDIFSSNRIDKYIKDFIDVEVLSRKEDLSLWRDIFSKLISIAMNEGLPIEKTAINTFNEMQIAYKCSLESLLYIHSICAIELKEASLLEFNNPNILLDIINTVKESNPSTKFSLINYSLSGLAINRQNLDNSNLNNFVFEFGEMNNVSIRSAVAHYSEFNNYAIKYCSFDGSFLEYPKFNNSEIIKSTFYKSSYHTAVFNKVKLNNCGIKYSNFMGSYFNSCEMVNLSLICSNFSRVDFNDVVIDSCRFIDVNFSHSKINNCVFRNLKMTSINFSNSFLNNVIIESTHRSKFDFTGARLVNVELRNVNVSENELREVADCSGVVIHMDEDIVPIIDEDSNVITW